MFSCVESLQVAIDLTFFRHYKGRVFNNSTPSFIMANRPLNVGLVGGGRGAFIVHAHQKAIHSDGTRRISACALSSNPKTALEDAAKWPYPIQAYASYD